MNEANSRTCLGPRPVGQQGRSAELAEIRIGMEASGSGSGTEQSEGTNATTEAPRVSLSTCCLCAGDLQSSERAADIGKAKLLTCCHVVCGACFASVRRLYVKLQASRSYSSCTNQLTLSILD